jgi:hypothetical protein
VDRADEPGPDDGDAWRAIERHGQPPDPENRERENRPRSCFAPDRGVADHYIETDDNGATDRGN